MSYKKWFDEHADKHTKIVDKLLNKGLNKEQIIEYFDFENMKIKELEFCPLYTQNKKCHDMESLNCYLCACPNFRFNDDAIKSIDNARQFSLCSIDSKDGKQGVYGDKIHQDCSKCSIPHHKDYVSKHFNLNWRKIMKKCDINF